MYENSCAGRLVFATESVVEGGGSGVQSEMGVRGVDDLLVLSCEAGEDPVEKPTPGGGGAMPTNGAGVSTGGRRPELVRDCGLSCELNSVLGDASTLGLMKSVGSRQVVSSGGMEAVVVG
jgi:hypothetical protein